MGGRDKGPALGTLPRTLHSSADGRYRQGACTGHPTTHLTQQCWWEVGTRGLHWAPYHAPYTAVLMGGRDKGPALGTLPGTLHRSDGHAMHMACPDWACHTGQLDMGLCKWVVTGAMHGMT